MWELITHQRLADARNKLRWAEAHATRLRAEIVAVWDYKQVPIPTYREFDAGASAVVFRHPVGLDPVAARDWPLLLGDAIHNFRASLDYVWWQLATDHLGREPAGREAADIQFPIVSDKLRWAKHRFLRHVSPAVATRAADVQPFNTSDPGSLHALWGLAQLSNHDKHRTLHVMALPLLKAEFQAPPPEAYVDCRPELVEGASMIVEILKPDDANRHPEEMLRIKVVKTGPIPDVELGLNASGYIAINGSWDIVDTLHAMEQAVGNAIVHLEPMLK